MSTPAVLALEDGTVFRGVSVGAKGNTTGEVVFNTAMTGYQEILTDPSYCRQIVTLTYPHIGNTGTTPEDLESGAVYAAGLVIRDLPLLHSNWRATESLPSFLLRCKVVAIADIDTRKLTRLLREKGAQSGCIMTGENIEQNAAVRAAKKFPGLKGMDLAKAVSTKKIYQWNDGLIWKTAAKPPRPQSRLHVVAYDYGMKRSILRILAEHGCRMTVVPAQTPADQVLAMNPDGIFLSNGPGDPEPCDYAISAIAKFLETDIPVFGICLGHQLLGLASGARDYENEVRASWRESSGTRNRFGAGADFQPEPWLCGRRSDASGNLARHAPIAIRRLVAGPDAHRSPGLQLSRTPGGQPRPPRPAPAVRALHVPDGEARAGEFARPHAGETKVSGRLELLVPKRTDLDSILIIGAGPIIIGQACEFDYSGAQACKALKEEGYRVILVNSNPATIMTDPETADAIYIEPINWRTIARIIEKERPTALLPTMGGQTALNTALDLVREGILEKFNVEMIGASQRAIDMAEDRELFRRAMADIGLETARARIAHSMEEALAVQSEIGFPTVIRPSFTLGGSGGGIAYNREEFEATVARGLDASPTNEVLLEESVLGWKEFEMEVVRDHDDNCIIVCSIENIDPMGVHTGDSITVAPAQSLTDREYQRLRDASIAVLRKIGVDTGGSNVQFAINPEDGRVLVIEMNPRVSRSSALASKATGFPIAKIAAKLAVGYTLSELKNEITGGATPASFEPTIDYVVTKIPRFTFEKFPGANTRLTTQMKSVGEAMAIGRTFQESMQKALRSLETGYDGFNEQLTLPLSEAAAEKLSYELRWPGPDRILYVADAFRAGWTLQQVFDATKIDPWFLSQIEELLRDEALLVKEGFESLNIGALAGAEAQGLLRFAPRQIGGSRRNRHPPRTAQARIAPGLQARRYLCGGVWDRDGLFVFDLRRGMRGGSHGAAQNHDLRGRSQSHRPGNRVRLLLRARRNGPTRRRLRDHHGELQPRDRVHRL